MDKLLVMLLSSFSFIVLLSFVNSAPTSKIMSSLQKQSYDDENVLEKYSRQHKMMDFYNPYIYLVPFYPPEFYDDFAAYYGYNDDDEIMSRTAGNRKRPGSFKNSPIYYIKLPPVPYMFIPELGYVSNPPTYNSLPNPQYPMQATPPAPTVFYNLPLDFISNGKPSNIFSWGSPAFGSTFAGSASPPQFTPTYQQPYQRPMNPFLQESKVTNLKGQYLFNGRPEKIFVLPSSYNSIYPRFVSPFY